MTGQFGMTFHPLFFFPPSANYNPSPFPWEQERLHTPVRLPTPFFQAPAHPEAGGSAEAMRAFEGASGYTQTYRMRSPPPMDLPAPEREPEPLLTAPGLFLCRCTGRTLGNDIFGILCCR